MGLKVLIFRKETVGPCRTKKSGFKAPYGFISKHPTTGAPIASPFVQMSVNYLRAANLLWQQIFIIVRENCAEYVDGSLIDDEMERLLRS